MKKKILSILSAGILLSQALILPAYAQTENKNFVIVKTDCEEGEKAFNNDDYDMYNTLSARYADDKTPIALSAYYDGRMYATIPAKNADRAIEWYNTEEKKFNDNDDENLDGMYYMKRLAEKGVLFGDENGNANPNNNITRAEATAMVMRFLGLDGFTAANSGFTDVPQDSWFAKAVTAARDAGIISGTSDTEFEPSRNITRAEVTVMTVKALQYAGLAREINNPKDYLKDNLNPTDLDEIPEWAMGAYAVLNYSNITDYDYIDNGPDEYPTDLTYTYPNRPATRSEYASLLYFAGEIFQTYPSKIAEEYGFDKDMPVIDGSTSTYPFTQAIYGNLFYNGYQNPDMPKKHSKSHASYQRLINKEVDVIIASVYPADDIVAMAKENNVELDLVPIAYDAMIFFTNKDNTIDGLTQQQITDIYVDNKYSNWSELGGPDALLYPYCRNNDSGSHAQMQRHFLNGNEINENIRKESTSVAMADILTDVMDAETENPLGYGLGYSIYYYFNNMDAVMDSRKFLKLLKIDGVYPSTKTIADGTYPLSNNTYVVFRKDEPEDSKARKFAEFMLSPLGQQCVSEAGFGPLNEE